jgi:hypothetical protein
MGMKRRIPILSMLIFNSVAWADDYVGSIEKLKKSQAELSQMIAPYKAIAGFRESTAISHDDEKLGGTPEPDRNHQ